VDTYSLKSKTVHRGGSSAKGTMRSDSIVKPSPLLDEDDGLGKCVEDFAV
jgi:hypothetical protein